MNANWSFESGNLIATDDAGKVLYSVPAPAELGTSTADALNHFAELGDVLLTAATGSCPR